MPRESVNPELHADLSMVSDGESEGFIPQPTLEISWSKGHPGVSIGLETPSLRGLRGEGSTGQHHLIDHLYGHSIEEIGRAFMEQLRIAGWEIKYRGDAVTGISLPSLDDAPAPASNPGAQDATKGSGLLGRMILDAVTGAIASDGFPGSRAHTGWYTTLTREGCNRAIRILRKARDKSSGKDE